MIIGGHQKMLKTSKYNFIWPVEGSDNVIIFNSFTTAAVEINRHRLDFIKHNKNIRLDYLDEKEKETALYLLKGGFLIEDFIDEMSILKVRNGNGRFRKDILSLTIIPTFKCNLKCFYCYQDRNITSQMSSETQDALVQYISKSAMGIKKIEVVWYGGEPLLAWDTICSLSKRIIKIADENNCKYNAGIVTNGYLFDEDKISKLKELKINTVQITLDGPPKIHSLRKGLPGDPEADFEKMLSIIDKLIENKADVAIRINIDKTNMNSIDELLDILSKRNVKKAVIYPGQVTADTKICRNIDEVCLHTKEFSDLEVNFYKLLVEKDLKTDFSNSYPKIKSNFCCADQANSFIVSPEGYVYKCWSEIDGKNDMIFDILKRAQNPEDIKRMHMKKILWNSWNPFEFEKCIDCKLLPICMGGCPYSYKIGNNREPVCITLKDNLEQIVMNHYYCTKIKKLFND